jgi:hypothetical protein
MFLIQIHAQSVDRFFEVLPGEKENAELMVEDLVSHILLEHFDEVIVDRVTVDLSRDQAKEQFYWSIFGEAYCPSSSSPYSERMLKSMEFVLMERISSFLADKCWEHHHQICIVRTHHFLRHGDKYEREGRSRK